jgi:hypothetical protein
VIRDTGVTPVGKALVDQGDISPTDIRDAQVLMARTMAQRGGPMFEATLMPAEEQHGAPIPDEA